MHIEVSYSNPTKKETFQVSGKKIVFGRSLKADVSIRREEMSRYHFQIDIEHDQYFITDLNSSNGVLINGERLPPQVRLPYNIFFPIEIANQISIHIKEEVEVLGPMTLSLPASNTGHQTAAKSSSNQAPKKEITRHKQKNPLIGVKPNKTSSSLQLFFPLLIIVAIPVYLYFGDHAEKTETIEWQTSNKSQNDHINNKNSIEHPKDSSSWPMKSTSETPLAGPKIPYQFVFEKSDCSNLGNACLQIGLTNPKEGIVYYDGMLFIFVNLDFIPEKSFHPKTKLQPLKKKAEYYLAQRGTQEALQQILRDKAPSSLNIIGFNIVKDAALFKYHLVINFLETPPMDQEIHRFLFHDIFYKGDFDLYQHYIGHYSEMAEIQ